MREMRQRGGSYVFYRTAGDHLITRNDFVLQSGFHLEVALCERDNTCLALKKKKPTTNNKKNVSNWKLVCHIALKIKKNATLFFCSVKKEMVNWDDIFIFRHKAQVGGEGTPVPFDLADSAIWLIELLSEAFIHIIRNIRKVYRCKFSNYCLALCILMRVVHTRYSERLTRTDLP